MPTPSSFRTLLVSLGCFFILMGIQAQKNIYESPKFKELSAEHQELAIIPFITLLDLDEHLDPKTLGALEEKEGIAVQSALETYFLQRKKKKKFSVSFQNTKNTNALLAQNKINYNTIDAYTVKELCELLGVDALVSGTVDLNILLSKGVPSDFSFVDFFMGDADYGRIGIKVSDGESGKLLWKYEKTINKKSGKNTNALIDGMMKQASKKFPYEKEKGL